jgi:glucose/mannose transport system substrate-binding protein
LPVRRAFVATALGLLSTFLAGCGAGAVAAPEKAGRVERRSLVEIVSWWFAPGESDAVSALIEVHRASHPEARVFNSGWADGVAARKRLAERLADGTPPDLFLDYMHARHGDPFAPGAIPRPLDQLFAELGLRDVLFPEILDNVTRDGHVVEMPINIHRENALFYNKRLFAAHGLGPPTSTAELLAVCRTLKAAGVTPIATAHAGWILRMVFNSLAMGKMGSVRYHDYFSGKTGADVPLLREVIDLFADVLEHYVNSDAGDEGFTWTSAAQAVYNGDAAMLLHGDWAKGYFVQLGWRPDVDFGVVGAPGANDMFLYGVDAFVLPQGAKNEVGARELLATVASPEGQAAFNRIKGSSPVRRDVPRDQLDSMGRATLDDLEHAKVRMLVRGLPSWEDALARFAKDHDRAALLRAFLRRS